MVTTNIGRVVGLSAYEVAVNKGYSGTEEAWLTSLKGEDGVQFSPQSDDLTLVSTDSLDILQLADRVYTANTYKGKGYKILRENVVNGSNILTQAMVSESNTIYEVRYDFDLNEQEITVPENSTFNFNGGSLSNGKLVLQNNLLMGEITLKDIILSGSIRNEDLYSEWFEDSSSFISSIPVEGYKNLYFENKVYILTEKIILPTSIRSVYGNAATLQNYADGAYIMEFRNDVYTEVGSLTADLSKGAVSFKCENADMLSAGDIIILRDGESGSWGLGYSQGEICEVYRVDDDTVYLLSPVFGDYSASTSYVVSRSLTPLNIKDLVFCGGEGDVALRLNGLVNSTISNIKITGFTVGIFFVQSYGCTLSNLFISTSPKVTSVSNYGLQLYGVQRVTVKDSVIEAGNHAVSAGTGTGGDAKDIINREIIYYNIKANIYPESHYTALDFHPPCEYYVIDSCYATGVNLGGGYSKLINSEIIGGNGFVSQISLGTKNYHIEISNNKIANANITAGAYSSELEGDILIKNNHISSTESIYIFYLYEAVSDKVDYNSKLLITGNVIEKNSSTSLTMFLPGNTQFLNNVVTNLAIKINSITNMIIKNNIFNNSNFEMSPKTGDCLTIVDNIINGAPYYGQNDFIQLGGDTNLTTVIIKNNILTKDADIIYYGFTLSGYYGCLIIMDNVFALNAGDYQYKVWGSYSKAIVMNNVSGNENSPMYFLPTVSNVVAEYIGATTAAINSQDVAIFADKKRGVSSYYSQTNITPSSSDVGMQRFLSCKPIWWSGTAWVDATGTSV